MADMALALMMFFHEADINVIYDMPAPLCDLLFKKIEEASRKSRSG